MRSYGVNVDPGHWDDTLKLAKDVVASGATWVRTVIKPDVDLTPWIEDCHEVGLRVLGVIASESLVEWNADWTLAQYAAAAQPLADQYETILDAIQVGNESDQVGPSSWTMAPDRLNRLLRAFRSAFDSIPLVGPGMASGQPYVYDYRQVDIQADHPYLTPEDLRAVGLRAPANGQPLWLSEYPASPGMSAAIDEQPEWSVAIAFCWSDLMVPGYGLLDENDLQNDVYAEFQAVAISSPVEESELSQFFFGMKAYADAHPEVGSPVGDEEYTSTGYSQQMTTNGMLVYSKTANTVRFLPFA